MAQPIGLLNGYVYEYSRDEWEVVCAKVRVVERLGEVTIDGARCVAYRGDDRKRYAVTLAASHAIELNLRMCEVT